MDYNINELIEADNESFKVITKNKNDILNDIDFENEEDKKLCDDIITELEKSISDNVRNMKTVQIPFIGCIRINPVKRQIRDNSKHFSNMRKHMTKKEYKEYIGDYVNELKEQQAKIDKDKLIFTRIRRNNKNKYETLYKNIGKTYAEMFIYSIYLLKEIPYDEEWEEHYKTLKD